MIVIGGELFWNSV